MSPYVEFTHCPTHNIPYVEFERGPIYVRPVLGCRECEPDRKLKALTIQPGKFYVSRSGEVWCCYHAVRNPSPENQAAVYCIRVEYPHSGVEYFFSNGSYSGRGEHLHDLIREAPEGAGYV